ncbi:ABC transporter substrate-binding protein [Deferribacter abyssi]|uniref:ABC transporter substrate-binding protein n=1 Tax=Deferribacter abyssi TaxID=213806 RepID=UPI003C1D1047
MKSLAYKVILVFFLLKSFLLAEKIALVDWNRDGLFEDGFRSEILNNNDKIRFYSFSCNKDEFLLEEYIKFIKKLDVDLIYAVGFPVVKTISRNFFYTPVVFVMHHDPVEAGIVASYKNSENNLTGVVAKIPILQQLKTLKKIVNFNKVGIIRNTNDFEYELSLRELKRLEKFFNFKTVELNDSENIKDKFFKERLDVLYIYKSQKISKSLINLANSFGVLTLAADSNVVKRKGALFSLVVDEYRVGRFAGKKAVEILNGKRASKIPITTIEHFMLVINMNTAKKININIPLSLLIMTDKIIK